MQNYWKQHRDIVHSHFILHFKHTSSNISTLIKNTLYKMDIKKCGIHLKGRQVFIWNLLLIYDKDKQRELHSGDVIRASHTSACKLLLLTHPSYWLVQPFCPNNTATCLCGACPSLY